jgi:hypothetical protein
MTGYPRGLKVEMGRFDFDHLIKQGSQHPSGAVRTRPTIFQFGVITIRESERSLSSKDANFPARQFFAHI